MKGNEERDKGRGILTFFFAVRDWEFFGKGFGRRTWTLEKTKESFGVNRMKFVRGFWKETFSRLFIEEGDK